MTIDWREMAANEIADLKAEIARLQSELDAAREAVRRACFIAKEARIEWDNDRDERVGNILIALAGYCPGYRADIDAIHAALEPQREDAPCEV